ncbi:hypothetical protein KAK07_22620 [Ideonella sp. 4Y16]|uniref:EAL domain-containing protein n=1 Tax=Ideonella aquatica TaxID=2824119 RepID=A0A940YHN8_9BURK|nr:MULTISPECIES: hypothetical protein [Ideonella]MBQ0946153.1 hypothetical protein [Ideonella alba]MBQ0960423.1 hypothetical protein [Ideonella aquatica]
MPALEALWRRRLWQPSLNILNAAGFRAALANQQRHQTSVGPAFKSLGLRLLPVPAEPAGLSETLLDAAFDALSAFTHEASVPVLGLSAQGDLVLLLRSDAQPSQLCAVVDELMLHSRWRLDAHRCAAIEWRPDVVPAALMDRLRRLLDERPESGDAFGRVCPSGVGFGPAALGPAIVDRRWHASTRFADSPAAAGTPLRPASWHQLSETLIRTTAESLARAARDQACDGLPRLVRLDPLLLELPQHRAIWSRALARWRVGGPGVRVVVDAQAASHRSQGWRQLAHAARQQGMAVGLSGVGVLFGALRQLPKLRPDFVILSPMPAVSTLPWAEEPSQGLAIEAWARRSGVAAVMHTVETPSQALSLWQHHPEALVLCPGSVAP